MNNSNMLRYLPLVAQLGLTMAGSIFIGFLIGYFLDNRFETKPIGTLIFLGIGILSGFYSTYRLIMKEVDKK